MWRECLVFTDKACSSCCQWFSYFACHAVCFTCPLVAEFGTATHRQLALMKAVLWSAPDSESKGPSRLHSNALTKHQQSTLKDKLPAFATWASTAQSGWKQGWHLLCFRLVCHASWNTSWLFYSFDGRFSLGLLLWRTDLLLPPESAKTIVLSDRPWIWTFMHNYVEHTS